MAALNEVIQWSPEIEQKIDSKLLSVGFKSSLTPDTLYYHKDNCEFKIWKVRTGCFCFVKLLSWNDVNDDIFLIASNNNSYYRYRNLSLDEILNILTTCKDISKLEMYMANRDNLKALEVLACR
jgi:hypothetical protein